MLALSATHGRDMLEIEAIYRSKTYAAIAFLRSTIPESDHRFASVMIIPELTEPRARDRMLDTENLERVRDVQAVVRPFQVDERVVSLDAILVIDVGLSNRRSIEKCCANQAMHKEVLCVAFAVVKSYGHVAVLVLPKF